MHTTLLFFQDLCKISSVRNIFSCRRGYMQNKMGGLLKHYFVEHLCNIFSRCRCYRSMDCPSVCMYVHVRSLSHSCTLLKPLDGMRCNLDTLATY